MKLFPVQDQVLVRLDKFEDTFEGGPIVRPDIAQEKPVWGTVLGVGPGTYKRRGTKDVFIPTTVAAGQRVCLPWGTGHDLTIGGRLHVSISEDHLLAVEE